MSPFVAAVPLTSAPSVSSVLESVYDARNFEDEPRRFHGAYGVSFQLRRLVWLQRDDQLPDVERGWIKRAGVERPVMLIGGFDALVVWVVQKKVFGAVRQVLTDPGKKIGATVICAPAPTEGRPNPVHHAIRRHKEIEGRVTVDGVRG